MLTKIISIAIASSLLAVIGCTNDTDEAGDKSAATLSGQAIASATEASRSTVKAFGGKLKGELQKAMKAGGPLNALEVCNTKAPEISASVSADKGMNISRVSLKNRNPENAPNAWQEKVLLDFEARKAAGEIAGKLEHQEVATVDGKAEFRYMKAVVAGKDVCMACHGTKIKEPVQAKISELYPEDKAKGYELGDIRGAFVVTKTF